MHLCYLLLFSFFISSDLFSLAPLNIIRPYDETFLFLPLDCSRGEFNVLYEKSTSVWAVQDDFDNECTDFLAKKVNPLHIYQTKQDGLGMLKGFKTDSAIGQLAQVFTVDDDNNDRGHFLPCGNLSFQNAIITGRYTRKHISFTASLPICSIELKDVCWKDLTENKTAEDALAHTYLTDDFSANLQKLGCLNNNGYKRVGLSDLYIGTTYNQIFPRRDEIINTVGLQAQVGLTLPTGKKRDNSTVLGFEFGNNGSVGAVFAGGLDLAFAHYLRAGANAQFLYVFGNNFNTRVRTDPAQTDLLFLQQAKVYTKWGLTQKFYLYAELYRIYKGISLQAAYQYLRHEKDTVYTHSDKLYQPLANNSLSLQEWTMNTMVFKLRAEPEAELADRGWSPRAELFYKKGFNGRNAFLSDSIGGHISISF